MTKIEILKPGFCFLLRPNFFYVVMKRYPGKDKQYSFPFQGSEAQALLSQSSVLDSNYYIKRIKCLPGTHTPDVPHRVFLELTEETSNLLLSLTRLALGTASMSKDYNVLAQAGFTKIPDCLPELIETLQDKYISVARGSIKYNNQQREKPNALKVRHQK